MLAYAPPVVLPQPALRDVPERSWPPLRVFLARLAVCFIVGMTIGANVDLLTSRGEARHAEDVQPIVTGAGVAWNVCAAATRTVTGSVRKE